jgi:O-antigen ligase
VRAAKSVLVLAALWIVAAALPDAPAAHRFATALSVAVAAVAVVAVAQVVTCTPARYDAVDPALPPLVRSVLGKCRRAHGFYSIYMTLAGVLAVVLAAALPRLPALPRRGWAVAGWFVGAAALVLTIARSAWAGFAAGAVAAAALRRRGGRGRRTRGWQAAAGAAGLVALAVVLGVVVPDVRERARTIGDLRDDTTRERVTMLGIGLRLIAEHPVAGVGPGQVKHLYPLHAPPDALRRHTSHLHNTPLQIAVERGLVGLAIWLWIFVAFVRRAAGALRRLPAEAGADRALVVGSLAGVTAFLVAGVFEYNFGDTEVLLVVLSVMALPFVVERDRAGRAA